MNLLEYEKLDIGGGSDYIKFENTGDTKYLRFMYESGGDQMGADITFRRKFWDDENKKFIYDTDQGTLTCTLKCIEYDADGKNPHNVVWERSAYFCKTVLLPMWRNYPRIMDGVWKVTASNPKTKEATYSLFPVMNADTVKYPIIEQEKAQAVKEETKEVKEEQKTPATKKKYWE